MGVEVSFTDKRSTIVTRNWGVSTLVSNPVRKLASPITTLVEATCLETIDLQSGSVVRESVVSVDRSTVNGTNRIA